MERNRSKNRKKCIGIACLAVAVAVVFLLLFTPLNPSRLKLNEAQKENLCSELTGGYYSYFDSADGTFRNSAVVGAVDIFGTSGTHEKMTVCGYINEGFFIEADGRGYEISGSSNEFMVDVQLDGDNVRILEYYGDGVSTQATLDDMPWRYRCIWSIYTGMGREKSLQSKTGSRAEAALGVPIDDENTLSIDEMEGTYDIYDIDSENNITVKKSGALSELYSSDKDVCRYNGRPYKYRLEVSGKASGDEGETTYVVLSNLKKITFEQAHEADASCEYFDPDEAVLVGISYEE